MEMYKESALKILSKIFTKDITFQDNVSLSISGRRITISSAIASSLSIKVKTCCGNEEILCLRDLEAGDVLKIVEVLCCQKNF